MNCELRGIYYKEKNQHKSTLNWKNEKKKGEKNEKNVTYAHLAKS